MAELETTQGKKQLGEPPTPKTKRKSKAGRAFGFVCVTILILLVLVLLVNALFNMFMPHYYPTFGKYRLFAVVTDSMDPTIPRGHMIVDERPTSVDDVNVGSVITFEVTDKDGKVVVILTHRVQKVETINGEICYTTKGDNADGVDSFKTPFSQVIGVYTGNHCAFFGYMFGFLQSETGAIALIFMLFILVIMWLVLSYINSTDKYKTRDKAALTKSAHALSDVNLRYDNIREITAVMDVLGMMTEEPKTAAQRKEIDARLQQFINAETIELPKTPETAAILDSLPAPDTPSTLVAALRAGATLRQADDGQTLILTGMSGGKSIILTPIQTPDGIILCQQGVRLRSDIAPNIETVGTTSMPDYPEFFEGQPIKKNIVYPELPEPQSATFGPDMLLPHNNVVPADGSVNAKLAAPTKAKEDVPTIAPPTNEQTATKDKPDDGASADKSAAPKAEKKPRKSTAQSRSDNYMSKRMFSKYREAAAALELSQTEELTTLLNDVSPLSQEEQDQIDRIRQENKANKEKNKKPRAPKTPEQIAAQRERAEKKKAEQEAFLNSLSPADRDLYLAEQKLAKSRAATIRRLKRINADRKMLENLNSTPDDEQ